MRNVSLPARALAAATLAALGMGVAALPASAAKKPCRSCTSTPTADTTAPAVAISSPSSGSSVAGTVSVAGSSSDNAGVAKVEVSVDGGALALASGTSGWSWSWSTANYANGTHVLKAVATDTSGNASMSSTTVTVSNPVPDTTAPSVAIASPASGATVSGTAAVSGSASDAGGVVRVDVAVDGGAWSAASGTSGWSWSWPTAGLANGSHTLTARAVDAAGNASSTSVTVNVSNSTTATPPPSSTTAPNTQGSWTSPEGVKINVNSAGPWTISKIYSILLQNALDLSTIGPKLTINVQDQYASNTQTSVSGSPGSYTDFAATTYLKGVNSNFANYPDWILAHEYGHVWSNYFLYTAHNGDWGPYLAKRWSTADGSMVLGTDSRLDTAYSWNRFEIIAEDYRLLFGSSAATSQQPSHMNTSIPHPANVPGLKDFLLTTWR